MCSPISVATGGATGGCTGICRFMPQIIASLSVFGILIFFKRLRDPDAELQRASVQGLAVQLDAV